jgi:hypothetical protein
MESTRSIAWLRFAANSGPSHSGYDPRFADHKVSDHMVEARWVAGQSAANEMRQAEEEWLLGICRDFGVSVRIRPIERAYSYERSELASARLATRRRAGRSSSPFRGSSPARNATA